jgi:hypothetical protein
MLKGDAGAAQRAHDDTVAKVMPLSKPMGATSHHAYLNPQNSKEFLAVDEWDNLEGIQKLYGDPNLAVEFGKLFEGMPQVTVWSESGWLAF